MHVITWLFTKYKNKFTLLSLLSLNCQNVLTGKGKPLANSGEGENTYHRVYLEEDNKISNTVASISFLK